MVGHQSVMFVNDRNRPLSILPKKVIPKKGKKSEKPTVRVPHPAHPLAFYSSANLHIYPNIERSRTIVFPTHSTEGEHYRLQLDSFSRRISTATKRRRVEVVGGQVVYPDDPSSCGSELLSNLAEKSL